MASFTDSPLTFFSKATPEQFAYVLGQYREIFNVHAQETRGAKKNGPAELIKLDNWYQDTLPQLIKGRKDQMLLYDEIVQVTKWKLLRGKFRPSILDLVKTNTETAVKNVTKKAFKKMPNINAAMVALTQLKGIAPATASAILVAHSPNLCPYMADENMASTPSVEESDLSISEYMNYVEQTNLCVERLRAQDSNTDWTPHKVELAIWTLYHAKQYNSNLLDNMPLANGKSTNEQSNGKLDNEDDSQSGNEEDKQLSNDDEGVNSAESDENSNQSSVEQQSEMNCADLLNGKSDEELTKSNGNLHHNGNGLHEDESNQSSSASSENDKSNDSLLNNNQIEDNSQSNQDLNQNLNQDLNQDLNQNLNQDLNQDLNKETVTSSTVEPHNLQELINIQSNIQSTVEESNKNEMEVVTTSEQPPESQIIEQPKAPQNTEIKEALTNHVNNNEITSNLKELNAPTDKLNHCNGTFKNCINNVFNNETCKKESNNLKENLILSSEENSNNLSEENSNLSGSNLSYTDLHSTSDNALSDGPALKRIRVE